MLFWRLRLGIPAIIYHSGFFNTLRTGDANLRFYITTVQDGWGKSAFLHALVFRAQYT